MIFIGQGFDVHAFFAEDAREQKRELVLGGISFPDVRPLKGHSDADVVTHALMDALLGASKIEGASDIGEIFPDTNENFKNISSLELLGEVCTLLKKSNFRFLNADITVICEEPKIGPKKDEMREALANVMKCDKEVLSIKATTTEGLGFTGRKEGIAASAVCLLEKEE